MFYTSFLLFQHFVGLKIMYRKPHKVSVCKKKATFAFYVNVILTEVRENIDVPLKSKRWIDAVAYCSTLTWILHTYQMSCLPILLITIISTTYFKEIHFIRSHNNVSTFETIVIYEFQFRALGNILKMSCVVIL